MGHLLLALIAFKPTAELASMLAILFNNDNNKTVLYAYDPNLNINTPLSYLHWMTFPTNNLWLSHVTGSRGQYVVAVKKTVAKHVSNLLLALVAIKPTAKLASANEDLIENNL